MTTIYVDRVDGEYSFEAKDESGKLIQMDTSPEHGGDNFGIRPMQGLLMALGGCSGIDIVSIMNKQRQNLTGLSMKIEGKREQDKIPSLWETVHVTFIMFGITDIDRAKYAAGLSIDKYCSVAETLRRAGCAITWDVELRQGVANTR